MKPKNFTPYIGSITLLAHKMRFVHMVGWEWLELIIRDHFDRPTPINEPNDSWHVAIKNTAAYTLCDFHGRKLCLNRWKFISYFWMSGARVMIILVSLIIIQRGNIQQEDGGILKDIRVWAFVWRFIELFTYVRQRFSLSTLFSIMRLNFFFFFLLHHHQFVKLLSVVLFSFFVFSS